MKLGRTVSIALTGLALSAVARAQCEKAALTAYDGNYQELYGRSVALYDPLFAVGAPGHPINVSSGAMYVYVRAGTAWVLDQKLEASDNDPGDYFGASASMDRDRLVVGALEDDANGTNAGAAYVFRRDPGGWVQEAKLLPSVPTPFSVFGSACSIDDDRVAVGAPNHQSGDQGGVWVFKRTGTSWAQEAQLLPTFSQPKYFGRSVALEGDRLAVGAPGTQGVYHDAGVVQTYTFNGTSWVQQQLIVTPTPAPAGFFGYATALSGDRLAVGAFWENSVDYSAGYTHVYREVSGVWNLEQSIAPAELQLNDQFGRSVSLDGGNLVVGTLLGDGPTTDSGTAYLFQYDGSSWVRMARFWGSTSGSGDQFGVAVGVRGQYILAGADLHGGLAGAAYVFGRCP